MICYRKEGIRIEIKTSAYIQTWKQWRFSALRFGIGPTHAWDEETGLYAKEEKRQADVYVFCVPQTTKDQVTLNPLDLSQWALLRPLATSTLNAVVPKQKNIALSGLLAIGAKPCSFPELYNTIKQEGRVFANDLSLHTSAIYDGRYC